MKQIIIFMIFLVGNMMAFTISSNTKKNTMIEKYIRDYETRNFIIYTDKEKIYIKKKYGIDTNYECSHDDIEEIDFHNDYDEFLL
jgi:hypothetical protein